MLAREGGKPDTASRLAGDAGLGDRRSSLLRAEFCEGEDHAHGDWPAKRAACSLGRLDVTLGWDPLPLVRR